MGLDLSDMPAALMRFDFPVPLPCVADVLGARVPVQLPNVSRAELCMPLEDERKVGSFEGGAFQPPRLRGMEWFTRLNSHFSKDEWVMGWGSFHRGGPDPDDWLGVVRSAVLRVVTADVSDAAINEIGLTVNRSINDWYLLFRDWLEVLTHVDLGHEHAVPGAVQRSEVENFWWAASSRARDQDGFVFIQPGIVIRQRLTPHIERWELRRAAREANKGSRPPEPHLLLRDARSAFHRDMYRRCILDAAIAVEVLVSALLHQLLDEAVGEQVREAVVLDRDPISRKIPLLKSLGAPLPLGLQKDLFNVRNKVIHQGKQASRAEAKNALDAATVVVDQNLSI